MVLHVGDVEFMLSIVDCESDGIAVLDSVAVFNVIHLIASIIAWVSARKESPKVGKYSEIVCMCVSFNLPFVHVVL